MILSNYWYPVNSFPLMPRLEPGFHRRLLEEMMATWIPTLVVDLAMERTAVLPPKIVTPSVISN
jgi:hypothetical protein